jgi:hypothetical protein
MPQQNVVGLYTLNPVDP